MIFASVCSLVSSVFIALLLILPVLGEFLIAHSLYQRITAKLVDSYPYSKLCSETFLFVHTPLRPIRYIWITSFHTRPSIVIYQNRFSTSSSVSRVRDLRILRFMSSAIVLSSCHKLVHLRYRHIGCPEWTFRKFPEHLIHMDDDGLFFHVCAS